MELSLPSRSSLPHLAAHDKDLLMTRRPPRPQRKVAGKREHVKFGSPILLEAF